MRKFLFLSLALTLSAGLWANQITYTATAALPIGGDAFTPSASNHTFVNGVGYINFSSGDVTKINNSAFRNCTEMTSITIPASVTTIGYSAFAACKFLTSITFEGTACQYAIGGSAFQYVGDGNETTTNLTLPEDWNYANAPTNSSTLWYGGYFNSNLYSEDEATDKQAAIDALTAILSDYSTSAYLQSLLAEEVAKINSAVNRPQVNERKQAAIDRLTSVVNNYVAAKTELLGDMATPCTSCTAVEVTDGTTTVTLYKPTNVGYIKK